MVSVSIDGNVVLAIGGSASFDSFSLKTDDPFFAGAQSLVDAQAPAVVAQQAALSYAELAPIVEEAKSRWMATGLLEEEAKLLKEVSFAISDLESLTLGLASGATITIDADAAGWGWFVDPTPEDDEEFTPEPPCTAAARIDLLTVVMHEIGHLLGYGHSDNDLMATSLEVGVRRSPGGTAAGTPALWPDYPPAGHVFFSLPTSDPALEDAPPAYYVPSIPVRVIRYRRARAAVRLNN